jgi:tRNA-(ms[2]io[6]A)-hydroxylase
VNLAEIHDFLGCRTPGAWVEAALKNQETLLLDHKNNEFKAASTALMMIGKYGHLYELANRMSKLAREELVHFEQVMKILKERGIPVSHLTASRYAGTLHKQIRKEEPYRLIDTLVVGAFIEARSCERFEAVVPGLDAELAKFYGGLLESESRHFQGYLKLAYLYGDAQDVDSAVGRFREIEQELIVTPDKEFRFHSGVPALP